MRVPGVPAQYAAGQPNRAILRKKQRPLFPEDPCFWIWNGWIFSFKQTHKQRRYGLQADTDDNVADAGDDSHSQSVGQLSLNVIHVVGA